MTVVAADAIGNGPTTPNKSDPTSTSNVDVLMAPNEVVRVRLDIKDFLRNILRCSFESETFDIRARIKDITRK